MNKSNIIFALAGAAAGAGAMYLAMKSHFDELLNREVEDVKKYYDEKYSEPKETSEEEVIREVADEASKDEPNYQEIIEKLNYNEYSTKTNKAVDEKPYIISFDEYESEVKYEHKMLSYFGEDEVLIDSETDEQIDDIGRTVGFENLEHLCETEDDNEIYVRNERLGIDYYIIWEGMSYQDYIGGE